MMNLDDLTIGQVKAIAAQFGQHQQLPFDNGMVGKYVIVRCRDAGVHAGELVSHNGRECVLKDSRRLWYWKPANGAAFLSGVATEGLHSNSKVGAPVETHLTENCEILVCSEIAARSIKGAPNHVPNGDGSGDGSGYGDGDDYGYGSGSGSGYSDGDGSGDGCGYSYRSGDGYGCGYGYGSGCGHGGG